MHHALRRAAVAAVVFVASWQQDASGQLPAFPGAQGFGAAASGGRGGEVFHVNSLANTNVGTYEGANGFNRGTLRWCLLSEASSAPRTIVFDVGGAVPLTSQITIENSNMTVAGQTAPGQGLSTQGRPWLFESGSNLIVRHVRNRLGRNGGQDSMGVEGGTNIIFDHVTSSWSNDEALSVAKDGNFVTVQNSMIYEGLNHSGHGYGSLIRPDIDSKVSYHHNLYANNESRNPRPGTYNNRTLDFDFRNNVIYNWGDRAGYTGGSEGTTPEPVNMNFVGNYTIAGPSTHNNWNSAFVISSNGSLTAYQSGNLVDADLDAARDGVDTGWNMFEVEAGSLTQRATQHPLAVHPVTTHTAAQAYDNVLDHAGSFWWNRDTADTRVADQVRTQTGAIIDHESEVGGFPTLPAETRSANWDTDHDGMPDAWETEGGLNPNLATDRNNDYDTDGFTNLEEYLNEAGAWPAAAPISWIGGAGRFALNSKWDAWQPSRFDEVRITGGTATVDAIGQQAGWMRIGIAAGDNGALQISSGELEAFEGVDVGGVSAGAGTLHIGASGKLVTPLVTVNNEGVLSGRGTIEGDVFNQGGTIAPGDSAGTTHVVGDLILDSGVLEIEIGGTVPGSEYDRIEATGFAELGGTLEVKLLNGFVPEVGDMFGFLFGGGGFGGIFDDLIVPDLGPGNAWALSPGDATVFLQVVSAPSFAGDFDLDGDVDGRDFLVWQRNPSIGNLSDWQANYGANGLIAMFDLPAAEAASRVPEPAALQLILMAGVAFYTRRR
jgi:hypothetical protein